VTYGLLGQDTTHTDVVTARAAAGPGECVVRLAPLARWIVVSIADYDRYAARCGWELDVPPAPIPPLVVGARVRRVRDGVPMGRWKKITSLSDNFVTLDGGYGTPVAGGTASRRVLEQYIADGRVEVEAAPLTHSELLAQAAWRMCDMGFGAVVGAGRAS